MELQIIKIKDLKNAKYNPRKKLKPDDEEFQNIKKSIETFGYVEPVIVNKKDNTIIGGHQRVAVMSDLGLTEIKCCMVDIDKEKEKALNVALNKITGEWDFKKLTNLLDEIKIDSDDNFFATGFNEDEFISLNEEYGTKEKSKSNDIEVQEDNFNIEKEAEKIEEATAKLGDLYKLGKHFLLCGDSTSPEDVKKLFNGVEPTLMVTDPPYGVNYAPEWRQRDDFGIGKRTTGKVKNDDIVDWSSAYKLFPGDVAYVWHAGRYTHKVAQSLEDSNFQLISQIIWVKQHFAISRGDIHWQHEPCWYVCKKGKNHNWQGARNISTTWNIKNNNAFGNSTNKEKTYGHGTQKPIECMLRPIVNNTSVGQCVYDCFGGAGTTLIAAEQSGRVCYMMELDPIYIDCIIKRFEDFTGKKAKLISGVDT
jgi:DNA modification methylase